MAEFPYKNLQEVFLKSGLVDTNISDLRNVECAKEAGQHAFVKRENYNQNPFLFLKMFAFKHVGF